MFFIQFEFDYLVKTRSCLLYLFIYLFIYLFHLFYVFIYLLISFIHLLFVSPFLWKILKGEGWSRLYGFINCLENLNANIRSFGASHNGAMGPLN